ncbi:MAG: LLM class flavin-dependent oxidoreductase [Thermomicrobiales bacterium]
MKFGVFLPSFIWEGDGYERAQGIKDFARHAEELGFDSIFLTDHVITARRFYRVSWLEPLITHALVAGVTSRIRLGTSIVIVPLRQPVVFAKELATLQYLSGGRFIFGAGVGWYGPEFEACGTTKSVRGARTDEALEIIDRLLTERDVSFTGKHFQIDNVTIEPLPERRPPIWIGGGSQLADPQSPEKPRFAKTVMDRVARYDGWIPRPTSPPEQIAGDWQALQAHLRAAGRDPDSVAVVHENFMHVVETTDRAQALAAQQAAFGRVMSDERSPEYLQQVHLFGTPDEIVEKLLARVRAGVQYFILHTLTPDQRQLDLWMEHIIPHVESAMPAS